MCIDDKQREDFQDNQKIYLIDFLLRNQIRFDEVKYSMNLFENQLILMMNMYLK